MKVKLCQGCFSFLKNTKMSLTQNNQSDLVISPTSSEDEINGIHEETTPFISKNAKSGDNSENLSETSDIKLSHVENIKMEIKNATERKRLARERLGFPPKSDPIPIPNPFPPSRFGKKYRTAPSQHLLDQMPDGHRLHIGGKSYL